MSISEKLTTIAQNMQGVYNKGFADGYSDGEEVGWSDGYDIGYTDGHRDGYMQGDQDTYNAFWNGFINDNQRTDYSYAFANWSHSQIIPPNELTAEKVIYMFMECRNLQEADNISIIVKNNNPSMQGFCMGNYSMIKPPDVTFVKKDGSAVQAVRTWISAYANCKKMQNCSIYLGDGTQDPIGSRNSMQNTFVNCEDLVDLVFEGKGSPMYLDLSGCKGLSYESMLSLKEALMDVSGATSGNYDIKIAAETYALLSDEDKASFEDLGWNLVVVEK